MAGMTRTDALPILEEMYINNQLLDSLVFKDRPLLGILEKRARKGGGKHVRVPVKYVDPQGRSATFSMARDGRSASKRKEFQVPYRSNYGVASVDGDVKDDCAGNTVMLTDILGDEMDGAIENLTNDVATELFRNHGGSRGRIDSGQGTATVRLQDPEDTINFEVGQRIALSANDGSATAHTLRDSGDYVTLIAIDAIEGDLTADATWSAQITGAAAADHMFVRGDFQSKMSGLDSWCPATDPAPSESYHGVDRSVHTRLGGLRFPSLKGSIDQVLLQAIAIGRRLKAKFDLACLNPIKWNELVMALESTNRRVRYGTVQGSGDAAKFGYDAIIIATATGSIPVISDPFCQVSTGWLLNTEGIVLWYSGRSLVHLIDDDGLPFLRETDNDGFELRAKSRATMAIYDPGHQARVTLAA